MVPMLIVEANLRVAMSRYAYVSENGGTEQYPGVSVTSCGIDMPVFNSALLTERVNHEELAKIVAQCDKHFRAKKVGWSFWLCDDLVAVDGPMTVRQQMHREGLALVAQPPGMYAESVAANRELPREIEFVPVNSPQGRLEFAHVSSIVFALQFPSALRIYGEPALWTGPGGAVPVGTMHGWVARVNKRAAGIITVVVAAGAAGVYSLGMLPEFRRRGYGAALLRHALDEIRIQTGVRRSVLQSTEDGFALYSRLGYTTVTRFSVYTKEN